MNAALVVQPDVSRVRSPTWSSDNFAIEICAQCISGTITEYLTQGMTAAPGSMFVCTVALALGLFMFACGLSWAKELDLSRVTSQQSLTDLVNSCRSFSQN